MNRPNDNLTRTNEHERRQRQQRTQHRAASPSASSRSWRSIFFLQNGERTSIDFLFFEKRTTIRWSLLMAIVFGVGPRPAVQHLVAAAQTQGRTTDAPVAAAFAASRRDSRGWSDVGPVEQRCRSRRPRPRRHRSDAAAQPRHRLPRTLLRCRWPRRWPTGFHCVAFDYRGHGDTPLAADPADRAIDWERYADDAQAVATSLRRAAGAPIVGFGHSMGGACLLMAAHRDPSLFDRLVLFEPIVFPPPDERPTRAPTTRSSPGRAGAATTFPCYEAAIANFAAEAAAERVHARGARGVRAVRLRRGDDGQVHLKCDPGDRGRHVRAERRSTTRGTCSPRSTIPVLVVAGRVGRGPAVGHGRRQSPSGCPNGTLRRSCDDLDHFGPMTHPERVVADAGDRLRRPPVDADGRLHRATIAEPARTPFVR